MKNKIRRISDWKTWKSTTNRHNSEILLTHVAVIVAVFIFAACL